MLTMQACFKQEREAFIQDLQVLHRQLEAKDRDHARRERESQAACARARAEARAAQERAASLQKEADGAAAALAAAVARAGVASDGLDGCIIASLSRQSSTQGFCIANVWDESHGIGGMGRRRGIGGWDKG